MMAGTDPVRTPTRGEGDRRAERRGRLVATVPVGVVVAVVALVGVAGVWPAVPVAAAQDPVADCTLSATEIEPGESVTLDASGSENATAYRYDRTGDGTFGSWTDLSSRTFTYDEAGTYEPQVQVRSADDTTDTASCGTLTVEDPNEPPTADFSYSPSDPEPGETVSFVSESSDPDGEVVAYEWTVDGAVVGEQASLEYTFEEPGEYIVGLEIIDDDGARDGTETTVTVEDTNEPPTVEVSADPSTADVGEEVTVVADAADSDGEVVSYEWTVDGETVSSTSGSQFSLTFEQPGEHLVAVTVTDDDGATASAETTVTVEDSNEPPTVEFTYSPTDPVAGDTVSFVADAADPDGEVVAQEWTVDGEVVSEGASLEYAFEEPGEYGVSVTVTDDDGATSTADAVVTVGPADEEDDATEEPPDGPVQVTAQWAHTPRDPAAGQRVTLIGFGPEDPRLSYRWDVDDDGNADIEGRFVGHAFEAPGRYPVTLTVVGPDGTQRSETRTVVVGDPQDGGGDDGLSVWMTPTTPRLGERVTLIASVGGDAQVEAYQWDLDGDGTYEAEGRTVTHVFQQEEVEVSVQAVGADGETAETSMDVQTGGDPVGSNVSGPSVWISPVDPQPDQRVTLVAEAAVPSGEIEAYRWDLDGDGEYDAEGRAVTTSFSEDAQYTVGLTVERTNGSTATVEQAVVVGNASYEPPGEQGETTPAAEATADVGPTASPPPGGDDDIPLVPVAVMVVVIVLAGLVVGRRLVR